eukprot:14933423-Alexandrium_andersonii.AAC.1
MSASLVGSEMCIRDRFGAVPGPAQFKRRTPQAISHRLGSECSTAIRIPVSYTHLTLPTICSV